MCAFLSEQEDFADGHSRVLDGTSFKERRNLSCKWSFEGLGWLWGLTAWVSDSSSRDDDNSGLTHQFVRLVFYSSRLWFSWVFSEEVQNVSCFTA